MSGALPYVSHLTRGWLLSRARVRLFSALSSVFLAKGIVLNEKGY